MSCETLPLVVRSPGYAMTEPNDILSRSIDDLHLSVRATNALQRRKRGMMVRDLCAMTERDVLQLKGAGRGVLVEVTQGLARFGLALAPEPPPPPPKAAVADDGMVEMIEKKWADAVTREEDVHKHVYTLQHISMEFSSALSRLVDTGRTWRARALASEEALRTQAARIAELEAELKYAKKG